MFLLLLLLTTNIIKSLSPSHTLHLQKNFLKKHQSPFQTLSLEDLQFRISLWKQTPLFQLLFSNKVHLSIFNLIYQMDKTISHALDWQYSLAIKESLLFILSDIEHFKKEGHFIPIMQTTERIQRLNEETRYKGDILYSPDFLFKDTFDGFLMIVVRRFFPDLYPSIKKLINPQTVSLFYSFETDSFKLENFHLENEENMIFLELMNDKEKEELRKRFLEKPFTKLFKEKSIVGSKKLTWRTNGNIWLIASQKDLFKSPVTFKENLQLHQPIQWSFGSHHLDQAKGRTLFNYGRSTAIILDETGNALHLKFMKKSETEREFQGLRYMQMIRKRAEGNRLILQKVPEPIGYFKIHKNFFMFSHLDKDFKDKITQKSNPEDLYIYFQAFKAHIAYCTYFSNEEIPDMIKGYIEESPPYETILKNIFELVHFLNQNGFYTVSLSQASHQVHESEERKNIIPVLPSLQHSPVSSHLGSFNLKNNSLQYPNITKHGGLRDYDDLAMIPQMTQLWEQTAINLNYRACIEGNPENAYRVNSFGETTFSTWIQYLSQLVSRSYNPQSDTYRYNSPETKKDLNKWTSAFTDAVCDVFSIPPSQKEEIRSICKEIEQEIIETSRNDHLLRTQRSNLIGDCSLTHLEVLIHTITMYNMDNYLKVIPTPPPELLTKQDFFLKESERICRNLQSELLKAYTYYTRRSLKNTPQHLKESYTGSFEQTDDLIDLKEEFKKIQENITHNMKIKKLSKELSKEQCYIVLKRIKQLFVYEHYKQIRKKERFLDHLFSDQLLTDRIPSITIESLKNDEIKIILQTEFELIHKQIHEVITQLSLYHLNPISTRIKICKMLEKIKDNFIFKHHIQQKSQCHFSNHILGNNIEELKSNIETLILISKEEEENEENFLENFKLIFNFENEELEEDVTEALLLPSKKKSFHTGVQIKEPPLVPTNTPPSFFTLGKKEKITPTRKVFPTTQTLLPSASFTDYKHTEGSIIEEYESPLKKDLEEIKSDSNTTKQTTPLSSSIIKLFKGSDEKEVWEKITKEIKTLGASSTFNFTKGDQCTIKRFIASLTMTPLKRTTHNFKTFHQQFNKKKLSLTEKEDLIDFLKYHCTYEYLHIKGEIKDIETDWIPNGGFSIKSGSFSACVLGYESQSCPENIQTTSLIEQTIDLTKSLIDQQQHHFTKLKRQKIQVISMTEAQEKEELKNRYHPQLMFQNIKDEKEGESFYYIIVSDKAKWLISSKENDLIDASNKKCAYETSIMNELFQIEFQILQEILNPNKKLSLEEKTHMEYISWIKSILWLSDYHSIEIKLIQQSLNKFYKGTSPQWDQSYSKKFLETTSHIAQFLHQYEFTINHFIGEDLLIAQQRITHKEEVKSLYIEALTQTQKWISTNV